MTLADDINLISTFLSHNQIPNDLLTTPSYQPYDCVVLCVSAIFHCAETLFQTLQLNPHLTKTLVLCGGIGHSTPHLYTAIAKNPRYAFLYDEIDGLPEARVMQTVFERVFDGGEVAAAAGVKVLVEDESTNCGANALRTKELLRKEGLPTPKTVLVVQDPTMSLRTLESFKKVFEGDEAVEFWACPTFVPRVRMADGGVEFDVEGMGVRARDVWGLDRFLGLVLGEVERLRDDGVGYGPRGKGFIGHVDVPGEVLGAYERVGREVRGSR